MSKVREVEELTVGLKQSRDGEVYYANKYAKWKEHATVNRIENFHLADNYLNLESYCEGYKRQLLRYQTLVFGSEVYRERASSSGVRQVFPALPLRPLLEPSLYFSAGDRKNARVKQILKATYRVVEENVVGDDVSVNDVKGKCPLSVLVSRAYKACIQELVRQKKGSKNVVVRR